MHKRLVVKSNKLIEAGYRLSLNEQRVILLAITRVRRDRPLAVNDEFEVYASDLVTLFGVDPKNAYNELFEVSKTLFNRYVTINDPFPEQPKITTLLTRWISSVSYAPQAGMIVLSFAQNVIPFLSELESQFTKYKLEAISKMTSVYAIRLYELLMQWGSIGKREISIDWLKQQFQVDDKYSTIRNLKVRVIEPAIAQINEHTDLKVSYTQRKTGRNVTHLTFSFEPKLTIEPPQTKKIASSDPMILGVSKTDIERLARVGESYEQAATRIKQQGLVTTS